MPTFGMYETVAEVSRGAICSVWSARKVGGDGGVAYAVKVCQPDVEIAGREQAEHAVALFREQVDAQRRLAGLPGSAWAPIHEFGEVNGGGGPGAYYVTDYYARASLERMVTSRHRVEARTLHAVVKGVLAGIRQSRDFLRRPHGSLGTSNVLLIGEGSGGGGGGVAAQVVLTDPAAESQLKGRTDVAGDLRELGGILYQLVTHQSYHERFGWPVGESADWKRLANGEKWRALCNRLLDPNPGAAPTVEEIEQTLLNMGAGSGASKGKLIALGAVGLLVVAGVVVGVMATRKNPPAPPPAPPVTLEQWVTLVDEYNGWFGGFAGEAARLDPARVAALGKRAPEFEGWLKVLRGLPLDDPWEIAGVARSNVNLEELKQAPPASVAGRDASRATAELLGVVQGIRESLASAEWSLAKEGAALAAKWRDPAVDWSAPAAEVDRAVAAVKPEAALLKQVGHLIEVLDEAQALERARAEAMGVAGEIGAESRKMGGDAVLDAFAGWAGAYPARYASEQGGAADGEKVLGLYAAGVARVAETGGVLTAFLASPARGNVCLDELTKNKVYSSLREGATPNLFVDWANEAKKKEYANPAAEEDPRRGRDLATPSKSLADELAKLTKNGIEAPAGTLATLDAVVAGVGARVSGAGAGVAERVAAVGARLTELAGRGWDCRTRKEIESVRYETVLVQMAEVERAWRLLNAEKEINVRAELERLAALPSPASGSESIKAWWVVQREAVFKEPDEGQRVDRARALERRLGELDTAVAHWAPSAARTANEGAWLAPLGREAAARRDAMIGEFLRGRDGAAGWTDAEGAALGQRYAGWVSGLESVVASVLGAERLLNDAHALDEAPQGGGATVRALLGRAAASPVYDEIKGLLSGVTSRAAELEGVARATTAVELAAMVSRGVPNQPELTIAAWRRLGEVEGGRWPSTAAELDQEARVFTRDLRALPRQAAFAGEIAAGRQARWESFVERAGSEAELAAALDRARTIDALGVDPAKATRPLVRYRLAASEFRAKVGAPGVTDEQVREAVGAFVAAVPAELRSDARMASLTASLTGVVSGVDEGPPKRDPKTLGPGSLPGWAGEEFVGAKGEAMLRFTRGAVRLEFVRVEAGPGVPEAVYIGAGEVTLGQFMGMVESATEGYRAVSTLMPIAVEEGRSPSGPRGWSWSARTNRMVSVDEWLQVPSRLMVGEAPGKLPAYEARFFDAGTGGVRIKRGMAPTDASPMQYVSPAGAVYAAAAVGCRLPTVGEWLAVANAVGVGDEVPNLRDRSWLAQRDHVSSAHRQLNRFTDQFPFPDADAFLPGGVGVGERATVAADAVDDGWLWFRPAAEPAVGVARLRGNVAEFVWAAEGAGATGTEPRPLTSGAAMRLAEQRGGELRIIGASALSPPELQWDQPAPVPEGEVAGGWADVGFRLAFSATGTAAPRVTKAEMVAAALGAPGADLFRFEK